MSVCQVVEVQNSDVDSNDCVAPTHCQVGTTLQYVCKDGFIGSNSFTKCLANHSWDLVPTCVKEGTSCCLLFECYLKILLYIKFTMYLHTYII